MTRAPWALALPLLLLVACSHRLPVGPDEAGVDAGPDDAIILPDGPLPDIGDPLICKQDQVPFTTRQDPRGNYTLVTPTTLTHHPLTVQGAGAKDSAAAINGTGLAALVITRATTETDPTALFTPIQQRFFSDLTKLGIGSAAVRASGTAGKSAFGSPEIKEAIWDLTASPAVGPAKVRDLLVAAALLKSSAVISGFPGAVTQPSSKLVVRVTLTLRPGQIALSAAVANAADYDKVNSPFTFLVDDMSNGTALCPANKKTAFECDIRKVSGKPVADIIWIVDESGSMNDNRQDIVNNANSFFVKAIAAGLDFRMGVAGMKKPGSNPLVELGRFCSKETTDPSDSGGTDRFLLPSEKDIFRACVKNPPYHEGGSEHGLTHGYFAVKRHLPRAVNRPDRIREGAHVAIIFVTDETAQELKTGHELLGMKGFLAYTDYKKDHCTLDAVKHGQLETFIKPLRDLYSSAASAGVPTRVHVIGGTCANACNAEIAYGYKELATATGGQLGDVCQATVDATLNEIINSITASASPRVLKYTPISSTLAVEAQGVQLPRSRTKGYMFSAANNSLTFINVKVAKGVVVVASYRRFLN
jgi:hypothetical protein